MKIRILFLILCLYFITFLSCYNNENKTKSNTSVQGILRRVYDNYYLGQSKEAAITNMQTKILMKEYKKIQTDLGKQFVEEHITKGEKYYSMINFIAPEADTLITGLVLTYSVVGTDLYPINSGVDKDLYISVPLKNHRLVPTELVSDLLGKITDSYGQYDSRDSSYSPNGIDSKHLTYKWSNRNNVDITLTDNQETHFETPNFVLYYLLKISYTYTSDFLRQLDYKKSKY